MWYMFVKIGHFLLCLCDDIIIFVVVFVTFSSFLLLFS